MNKEQMDKYSSIIKTDPETNKLETNNLETIKLEPDTEPKLKPLIKQEQKQDQIILNKLFILDPLSVIIKLVIISHKPIGTKINIYNNLIGIQEPGIFQPFVRYILNNNKDDLHYLYNPIEYACRSFLTETMMEKLQSSSFNKLAV